MFDFIIDFETMGSGEKAAVIDLAVIAFDPMPVSEHSRQQISIPGK